MQNGKSLRVVVVGAGIVGASIAYHLARRQVAVTVLERHRPGAGASSHSFAWINAFGKEPYPYHNLNRRSMEVWHRFAQGLQADVGLHWGGEMRWVHTAADAEALRQRIQQLQAWGYPNRLITATELQQLEPGLVPGTVSAASIGPIDGHVEPVKVIAACLQQARTHGTVVHVDTPVSGLRLATNGSTVRRVQAVQTAQGEIACDAVVLAAGTETTALAAMAGLHVPQEESPGVVVRTDPRPRMLQTVSVLYMPPVDAAHPEIHLRQLAMARCRSARVHRKAWHVMTPRHTPMSFWPGQRTTCRPWLARGPCRCPSAIAQCHAMVFPCWDTPNQCPTCI